MLNIFLLCVVAYAIYLCVKYYYDRNCSTCIHKTKCWNKEDKYCKVYKCEHYKKGY